jgi:hypothetical protein
MSVSAELEIPYQKSAAEATSIKVHFHSDNYQTYFQQKLNFGDALQLLNDLTKALQTHREAVKTGVAAAEDELASHKEDLAAA